MALKASALLGVNIENSFFFHTITVSTTADSQFISKLSQLLHLSQIEGRVTTKKGRKKGGGIQDTFSQ